MLTKSELYDSRAKTRSEWLLGRAFKPLCAVSLKRLGRDAKQVKRVVAVGVHEIGHFFLSWPSNARHYKPFVWVGSEAREYLHPHCVDAKCVMFQNPDLKTPSLSKGFMLIGGLEAPGLGMDEQRFYKNWFCGKCRRVLKSRIARLAR